MFPSMLLFGFLFGLRHALEADHIAAVAALSARTSSLRGLLRLAAGWGTGHSLTILAVGSVVIALGTTLPEGSETTIDHFIGLLLVLMGLDVVRRAAAGRVHAHVHEHDDLHDDRHDGGRRHLHLHVHPHLPDAPADRHDGHHDHDHSLAGTGRALAMGTLHGMAGSAALLVLVLPQAGSGPEAIASLAVFGAGSIAGMMLFSLALSFPLRMATRFAGATTGLQGVLGIATVLVGVHVMTG